MPDGVLSDTLHLTVTSAGAVQSWLFIKEISGSFFFFSHSYEFQTFSSSIHKWAPLWSLNDKPNFRVLTQILNNTQVFEHFHRMYARKDVCFCCHFTCTPSPSMSQSFPWLLILICHVSWKQQESAPFRKDWLYPTTFASVLNLYNLSLPFRSCFPLPLREGLSL